MTNVSTEERSNRTRKISTLTSCSFERTEKGEARGGEERVNDRRAVTISRQRLQAHLSFYYSPDTVHRKNSNFANPFSRAAQLVPVYLCSAPLSGFMVLYTLYFIFYSYTPFPLPPSLLIRSPRPTPFRSPPASPPPFYRSVVRCTVVVCTERFRSRGYYAASSFCLSSFRVYTR